MSKDKDSFVFYRDWYNAVTTCDEGTQLKLYRAIMEYVFLDLEPQDSTIQLAFSIIQQRLDADRQKWEGIKEKRKAAGRKGNEKRWGSKSEQMVVSVANANKSEQMVVSVAVNDNVNVNVDNDTKVSMLSVKENTLTSVKENAADAAARAVELMKCRKKEFYNTLVPYVQQYGKKMIRDFYDYWSEENKSHTKFRKELERTWCLERRLRTWAEREGINNNGTVRTDNTAEQRRDAVAERVRQLLEEDGNL